MSDASATVGRRIHLIRPYHWALITLMLVIECAVVAIAVAFPFLLARLISNQLSTPGDQTATSLLSWLCAFGLLEVALLFIRREVEFFALRSVDLDIQWRLHHAMLSTSQPSHTDLPSLLTYDLADIRRFLNTGTIYLTVNLLSVIWVSVGLFIIDPALAVVTVSVIAVAFLLVSRFDSRERMFSRLKPIFLEKLRTISADGLDDPIRATESGATRGLISRHESASLRLQALLSRQALLKSKYISLLDATPAVAVVIATSLSVSRLLDGSISPASLAAYILLSIQLIWPLRTLSWGWPLWRAWKSASDRVRGALSDEEKGAPLRVPDRPHRELRYRAAPDGSVGIGCKFNPGASTRIIAVVGAGTGFEHISAELAEISSAEGTQMRNAPFNAVSYCPVQPFVFGATVNDNITFGRQPRSFSIQESIFLAGADFVYELPEQSQTFLGTGNRLLSGGQMARIGIARSVYGSDSFVFLDNTLSGLDNRAKELILQRWREHSATAHRMIISTSDPVVLTKADFVLELASAEFPNGDQLPQWARHTAETLWRTTERSDLE